MTGIGRRAAIGGVHVDIVIPTIGRPALDTLLRALDRSAGPAPLRVIVVDDRPEPRGPIAIPSALENLRVDIVATAGGRGPATARNTGWRASRAEWIAFLDDDVVPSVDWRQMLVRDLEAATPDSSIAAVQGRVVVPLPTDRAPTNWERDVAGLAAAAFITADLAYRRAVLEQLGGFDELFTHAYREDADLAARVAERGLRIGIGRRSVMHPVGPADRWTTVRRQRGNAADARMRAKHGWRWRSRAVVPRGRLPLHALTTIAGVAAALGAVLPGARTRAWRQLGAVGFVAWCALTAEFAWARLRRGPRTRDELTTVLMTSALIPPVAVYHRLRGELVERRRVRAVLFDRDGTLVVDVPYNGDPELAQPVPEAARSLARLRAHGLQLAVVSNQSGVARGLLTTEAVERVNARIDDLLGPIAWWYCPHGETDACGCRKPAPGLVLAAAAALGVPARRCVVIGDTEADVLAARNARCRGILVPNARTRTDEIERAAEVAVDLKQAVDLVLGGAR